MNFIASSTAMNPGLYIVATPIGRMQDITLTAITTLKNIDYILCEDTRVTRKLLKSFDIDKQCFSLHKFNEVSAIESLLQNVNSGQAVALVSDAGTPAIHDPGYRLVAAMQQNSLPVYVIPGPSAVIAALSVAGCPADSFEFVGFLPSKANERQKRIQLINQTENTVVCFESPHRITNSLTAISEIMAPERELVCCRELTKMHETIKPIKVSELKTWLATKPVLKGEWVLVFKPYKVIKIVPSEQARNIIDLLVPAVGVSAAVKIAKEITSESKKELYNYAVVKYG